VSKDKLGVQREATWLPQPILRWTPFSFKVGNGANDMGRVIARNRMCRPAVVSRESKLSENKSSVCLSRQMTMFGMLLAEIDLKLRQSF